MVGSRFRSNCKLIPHSTVKTEMDKDVFVPFRSSGSVAVGEGCYCQPTGILRDTVSAQSFFCYGMRGTMFHV